MVNSFIISLRVSGYTQSNYGTYPRDMGVEGRASVWAMATEAKGLPSHGERGDALLWRMPPCLT